MNPIRYIRRFAAVLAVLAGAVLAATPAFARLEPDPGGYVAPARSRPRSSTVPSSPAGCPAGRSP